MSQAEDEGHEDGDGPSAAACLCAHVSVHRNSSLREMLQTTIAQAIFPSQYLRDAFAANGLAFENSTVLSYGIRQPTAAERDLLRHFGTARAVFAAGKEELLAVDGMTDKIASRITDVLDSKKGK